MRRRAREGHAPAARGDHGTSYVELLLALSLAAVVMALAVPVTAHVIDASRAQDAAAFVAARFRLSREQAVLGSHAVGVVFDQADAHWTFRVCADGNANGIRRADIASGRDSCAGGTYDLGQLFPGVTIAVDPAVPDPDGQTGSTDPVRFGSGHIASFSAAGTCTAGTIFLRSPEGSQYAIRVSNVTGRTRVLRYDPGTRTWLSS